MSAIIKEVYDAFRSAGVSDEQAAAAALAIPPRDELATKTDVGNLRTELTTLKSDFAKHRNEVKADIAELRAEVKSDITGLRSDVRELRADTRSDMKDLELRLTLKFFAAVGLAIAGIKALDILIG